ncbi:MAG: hypothetical protein WCP96_15260 [Methylococcaceae bacterium]
MSANNIQTIKPETIKGYYCKMVFLKDMIEDTINTSTVQPDQPMPDNASTQAFIEKIGEVKEFDPYSPWRLGKKGSLR